MYKFGIFYREIEKRTDILDRSLKNIDFSNDPETVHSCRVSIRRITGVLKLFNCPGCIEGIKNIASLLGPLRDMEVQIDFMKDIVEREGLFGDMLDDLLYRRELLKREIVNKMPEFSKEEFLSEVENALSGREVYEYKVYKKLYSRIKSIMDNYPVVMTSDELHNLRIKLKKIRYALEALSVDRKKYRKFVGFFKNYQDCLGEIHDADVWLDILGDKEMESDDFRDILREIKGKKITEFKELLHEMPLLLKEILITASEDVSEKFENGQELRAMKYSNSMKLAMSEKLSSELSPDLEHVKRIREKAIKIFDGVKDFLNLHTGDRFFLEAGVLLHDIGYAVPYGRHNVNSFNLISSSEYLPFSLEERIIISLIARSHRGKISLKDKFSDILPSREIKRILKISGILRAADGMEFESVEYAKEFKMDIIEGELVFDIGDVSEELKDRFTKKSDLLRGIFKKDFERKKERE